MFEWVSGVPSAVEGMVALVAAVAGAWGTWKGVYTPLRKHFNRVNAGMDTLLGYPAVLDPGSGRELQPATPPLATRVYDLEQTNKKMADALDTLAHNQKQLMDIQTEMEQRKVIGEQVVAEWMQWRADHEREARAREDRIAEWEAWRQEQTLMVEAMKNVHELPHREVEKQKEKGNGEG